MPAFRHWSSTLVLLALFGFSRLVSAQATHSIYLDLDNDAATGCSVATAAGMVAGVEVRLQAVIGDAPPRVTAVSRTACSGGAFGSGNTQSANYPVGLDTAPGGNDVIELMTQMAGLGRGGPARVVAVSETDNGADIVVGTGLVLDGALTAPPPALIPTTGLLGALLLVGLVLWIARRHPGVGSSMALLLLLGAGVVWAANFITDGQIGDWTGVAPLATDPDDDASSGEDSIEAVALYAAVESGRLFFRIDVVNAETPPNATPVANDAAFTVAENSAAGTVLGSVVATDADATQTLTYAITAGNTGGAFAIDPASGELSVATAAALDFEATPVFNLVVTVTDDGAPPFSDTAAVTVTLTDVNEAPVLDDQALAVLELAANGTVVGTPAFTEPDAGQSHTWAILGGNTGGAFSIAPGTGEISVANGAALVIGNSPFVLVVEVMDDGAPPLSDSATITISVTDINIEPSFTIAADPPAVDEDAGAQTVVALATAIDDNDGGTQAPYTFIVTANSNPALFAAGPAIDGSGTLTYTPAPDANGSATITVQMQDSGGTVGGGDDTSQPASFTITVNPVNDAPQFTLTSVHNVLQDAGPQVVPDFATGISAGPADEAGQVLAFAIASNSNAALFSAAPSIDASGTLSYTPVAGVVGSAVLTVTLSDDGGTANGGVDTSAPQTFTINVNNVNDPPTFSVPSGAPASLEDGGAQTVAGFATGIDDGDPPVVQALAFNVVGNTNPALFAAGPAIDPVTGDLTYTAAANANGSADVTVTLSDDGGTDFGGSDTSAPQTFTITVTAVNDAPGFSAGADVVVAEDSGAYSAPWASAISPGPADEAGQSLAFSATVTSGASLFSTAPAISPAGVLSFVVAPDAEGVASVDVSLWDDGGVANGGADTSAVHVLTITVTADDDPPVAVADVATVTEDAGAVAIDVLGNDTDIDGGPISVASVTQPANGTVVISGGGSGLTYAPDPDYCNTPPGTLDTFTYTLAPGSSTATVSVSVTCVDDDPVAVADSATVTEDDPATPIDVLANDTDVDGGPISVASVTQPANGTVVITGGGSGLSYQPAPDYCNSASGIPDTFGYVLAPGNSSATVSVTVICVADPAVAVADSATVVEDSAAAPIDVLANDLNPDGTDISVASVTQPANGTVVITGGGTGLSYTPNPDYCNTPPGTSLDTFAYTLGPDGSTATVTVSVTCVDDAPVAMDDTATVDEDSGSNAIDVLGNDTDVDGGPVSIASVTQPANGTVVITGGGSGLSYAPDPDYCNTPPGSTADTFTYTLAPGNSSATVSVAVNCINDPPTLAGTPIETFATIGNTALQFGTAQDVQPAVFVSGNLLAPFTDIDGPSPLSASLADANGHEVSVEPDGSFVFVPAPGAASPATFQYSVSDGGPGGTVTRTVTVNLFERVWYVRNNATSVGANGTSAHPFPTLVSAQTASSDNDYIFVYVGSGTSNGQSAGIQLKQGQRLLGEFVGLSVPVTGMFNGATDPVVNLVPASADRPQLSASGTGVVRASNAIPRDIRGLALSGGTRAIDVSVTSGAAAGSLAISDNLITSATNEGIDLGFGGAGAIALAIDRNDITAGGDGIDVERTAAGTGLVTITSLDSNIVRGNTAGHGIEISRVTFDATPGGTFQRVPGGTTRIGEAGNAVGAGGMLLASVAGNLGFDRLDIYSGAGAGLQVTGTPAAGPNTGFTLSEDSYTGTIVAVGGPAVDVSTAMLQLQLQHIEVSNSPGYGVNLQQVSGTFNAGPTSMINSPSTAGGVAFRINASQVSTNYLGSIMIGQGNGVQLTSNPGSTIRFAGPLSLSTGSNPAFVATGGGTVTATHAASTLATSSATALNVANTFIGSAGLVFRSISVNGGLRGIVLDNTGTTAAYGGLTVTGNGAVDGSGGTIQNTFQRGVSITSARNITLSNMNFNNAAQSNSPTGCSSLSSGDNAGCHAPLHLDTVTNVTLSNLHITGSAQQGINGRNVTGFALSDSVISGIGNQPDEDGIHFLNMLGTCSITNTSVTGSFDDNLNVQNLTGSSTLTISGSQFRNSNQGSGLLFGLRGTSNSTITVSGGTSSDNFSGGIVADAFETALLRLTLDGVTASGNNDQLSVSAGDNSTVTLDAFASTFASAAGDFTAVTLLGSAFDTGYRLDARLAANIISVANGVTADGLVVFNAGGGQIRAQVVNNTFGYAGTQRAMLLQAGQDGSGGTELTVTGNNIDVALDGAGNAVAGILAQNAVTGPGNTSSMCLDIGGSGISARNTFTHSMGGSLAGGDIRVRQRNDGTIRLPGYAAGVLDTNAVATYLGGRNTVVSPPTATADSSGFAGGQACQLPVL